EDKFLKPLLQLQVIGNAAEKRHRGMSVGVDETRRENGIGALEPLPGLTPRVSSLLGAAPDDTVAANRPGAVFDDPPLRVLGDHVAGAPDGIDRLGGARRRQKERNKKQR